MSEWIKELFVRIFGTHSEIATFLISMIPIVELRGAIPFGSAKSLWGDHALPLWKSFLISVLGGVVVAVVLAFLFWPIFNWLKKTKFFKKIATYVENKLSKNAKDIEGKTEKEKNEKKVVWIKIWSVFIFVSIPLPLTGVWTGTCLALFIGLNKKQTILVCAIGNMIAGLIMTMVSAFFGDNTIIVLYVFLVLVALFILYGLVVKLVKKFKNKKAEVVEKNESDNDQSGKDESLK